MALNVNVRRPTGQAIQRFNRLVSLHFSFLCRRNMALSCTTASLVWAEALLTTAPNQPPPRGRWVLTQRGIISDRLPPSWGQPSCRPHSFSSLAQGGLCFSSSDTGALPHIVKSALHGLCSTATCHSPQGAVASGTLHLATHAAPYVWDGAALLTTSPLPTHPPPLPPAQSPPAGRHPSLPWSVGQVQQGCGPLEQCGCALLHARLLQDHAGLAQVRRWPDLPCQCSVLVGRRLLGR